jgi:hypothetical protein
MIHELRGYAPAESPRDMLDAGGGTALSTLELGE